jgi:chemotaxis protein methyltransferase CheR
MEARLREFDFSDEDFNSLRALVRKYTGISLSDAKRELVYGRLSRRLRALGLDAFHDYRSVLSADPEGQEMVEFCNAITTNLTSFFRESHHFDYLRECLQRPGVCCSWATRRACSRYPMITRWSAGQSTGGTSHDAVQQRAGAGLSRVPAGVRAHS